MNAKRILSLLLALLLTLGLCPVQVFATESNVLELGVEIAQKIGPDIPVDYQFTPDKTGYYHIRTAYNALNLTVSQEDGTDLDCDYFSENLDYYHIFRLEAEHTYTLSFSNQLTHTPTVYIVLEKSPEPDSFYYYCEDSFTRVGQISRFHMAFSPGYARTEVNWVLSDSTIAKVAEIGGTYCDVEALSVGETELYYTSESGVGGSVNVRVVDPVCNTLTLDEPLTMDMRKYDALELTFTAPEDAWYVLHYNTQYLAVQGEFAYQRIQGTETGYYKYLSAGETDTCTLANFIGFDVPLTVEMSKATTPDTASFADEEVYLYVNDYATASLEYGSMTDWDYVKTVSVSEPGIISAQKNDMDNNVWLSGLAEGTVTLEVTTNTGLTASCLVQVFQRPASQLELGTPVDVPLSGNLWGEFTFTPEQDGYYAIHLDTPIAAWAMVTTSDYSVYKTHTYTPGVDGNLDIFMEAGVTYNIQACCENGTEKGVATLWIDDDARYVTDLEILALPKRLTYVQGFLSSYLDLSGLELNVTWSDGTASNYRYSENGINVEDMRLSWTCDEETGVVTLVCCEGTAEFTVTLKENPVASIAIVNAYELPGLLENAYYVEYGGYQIHVITRELKVQVTYTDGTSEMIGFTDKIEGYNLTYTKSIEGPGGSNSITVKILGKTDTCDLFFAENPVESIELLSEPDPLIVGQDAEAVKQGETLYYNSTFACRFEGLAFRIHYTDGTSEDVTSADFDWLEGGTLFYALPEYRDYPVEAMPYMPQYGYEFGYWTGKSAVDSNGKLPMILHYMGSYLYFDVTVIEAEAPVQTIASGWSGATQWTLTSDGVLTVYGSGNMKNYGYNRNQPWLAYADQITTIVIEEGVTAVGTGAFMGLTELESITLPETGLKTIGEAAFYGCSALKEIYIPDSVYTVFDYTFKGCTSLESIRLSKQLIKIGQGAFENCTRLDYIFVPTNVGIIGSWSFKGCTGLVEADMQWADATEIRAGAFKNCTALTTIHLPGSIQILGDSCFYGIGAESFTVPATVTEVQDWCFARSALKEITFLGDAPAIGTGAFNKITLTAYYPGGNATWTSDIMQNYGGAVTWTAN